MIAAGSTRSGGPSAAGQRAERALAAAVAALPLVYLLTEHSFSPVWWHYSPTLLSAIGVYATMYVLFLRSYVWKLPATIVAARTRLVVGSFSVVVALVAVEAALAVLDERPRVKTERLRGYAPDPDTGYVYTPDYAQRVVTLESATRWHSNALGLRSDRDYGPTPDGVVRVLALGDSFTVNTAVEVSDTWPGVLERRAAESKGQPTLEVVNAGHAGYGTMQMASWYRKYGVGLRPDLVLVAMTPNDVTDNGAEPPGALTAVDGYLAARGSGVRERRRFEHRERWYSLPGQIARSHVWNLLSTASLEADAGPVLAACALEPDEEEQRLHGLTEQYLLDIRDLAASQGASLGLLLITFREQLGGMAPGYAGDAFGERWRRFAADHGIAVVDTYPRMRQHAGTPPLFWRWDSHYTVEGSRVAGEAALDLVHGMLDERRARTP